MAKAICCFDPDESRTDFGRKIGGRLLAGDCCGIVYGVTGVCHQMANRILVGTGNGFMTSAAGYWLRVTTYGPLGTGASPLLPYDPATLLVWISKVATVGIAWAVYEAACLALTGLTAKTQDEQFMAVEDPSEREHYIAAAKLERDHAGKPELLAKHLNLLAAHRLGADFPKEKADKMDALIGLQAHLHNAKKPIDKAYQDKTISASRHASMVNQLLNDFLAGCAQHLDTHDYHQLFALEPDHKVELINPDIARAIDAAAAE